jgi:hypothetical protein
MIKPLRLAMKKLKLKNKYYFWFIFIVFLITRLFPYINNPVPTGYDAGLYLLNFKTFPQIPQWVRTGFAPGLYAFMYPFFKLGISPESVLIPLSIFSQIFLFFSFYFVAKKIFNQKIALSILFIFTASATQFRTFWYFYVNNTFALSFLLLALYFFSQKKFLPALLFSLLVGFFHLPTLLILFLIIVLEFLFNKNQRLYYLGTLTFLSFGLLLYYLSQFKQTIQPFFSPLLKSTLPLRMISGQPAPYGGAFYNLATFLILTILYLLLAVYGLYSVRDKLHSLRPFIVGLIVTSALVLTKFSFYQRFLIHLDIFLVFFAGLGLYFLFEKFQKKKEIIDFLKFYIFILIIFIFGFIYKTSSPLINKSLLAEIKYFSQTTSPGYILSLSREDPAWLMGYTNDRVIAQGFGDEDRYWTTSQWQDFFENRPAEEKISLLKLLPRPLYIFINDSNAYLFDNLKIMPCFKNKTLHFVEVEC